MARGSQRGSMGTLRVRGDLGGPVGIHVCTISASWPTDILSPLLSTLSTSLLRPAIDQMSFTSPDASWPRHAHPLNRNRRHACIPTCLSLRIASSERPTGKLPACVRRCICQHPATAATHHQARSIHEGSVVYRLQGGPRRPPWQWPQPLRRRAPAASNAEPGHRPLKAQLRRRGAPSKTVSEIDENRLFFFFSFQSLRGLRVRCPQEGNGGIKA